MSAGLIADVLLVAVATGLACLDRRGAFQAMLAQPLVAVPLLGAAMGDLSLGLYLGCILQLLWMSSVLFGANTPPNESLASMCIAGIALIHGAHFDHGAVNETVVWTGALLLGAPLAPFGRWLDVQIEQRNSRLAESALAAVGEGELGPLTWLPWLGLGRVFLLNAAVAALATALGLAALVPLTHSVGGALEVGLTAVGVYLVPAVGLAVALSVVRRRRGIALGCVAFIAVTLLGNAGGMG